eukprot:scaffold203376_cov17-Tisochrysis_lutea.AAC.1
MRQRPVLFKQPVCSCAGPALSPLPSTYQQYKLIWGTYCSVGPNTALLLAISLTLFSGFPLPCPEVVPLTR